VSKLEKFFPKKELRKEKITKGSSKRSLGRIREFDIRILSCL